MHWRRSWLDSSNPWNILVLTLLLILGFLSLYPTAMLFYGSFLTSPLGVKGEFTLGNYWRAYSDPEALGILVDSLQFALGASALSLSLASLLAWITVRTDAPLKRVFALIALAPNIFPPLLIAVSWTLLLSPSVGVINTLAKQVFGLAEAPFNIYSMPGLIFVEGLILTPLAYLIIAAALTGMDPSLEESGKVHGSNEAGVALSITFPLLRPALLAAGTLNFVRAMESFETPSIIALPARIELFTTKIYREALASYPPNHNLAAAYGVSLLLISLVFVYLYRRMTAQAERFATVTGRGFRPHVIELRGWRYPVSALALVILLLAVILPLIMLVFISLTPFYQVPTWHTFSLLTLKHYRNAFHNRRIFHAFENSLLLAGLGATVAMLLAAVTSYLTVKTQARGRQLLEAVTFLPWAFPGTALAIGLLWAYVNFPIPIYGTLWILLVAYVTRFFPYGLRAMTSTIIQIHKELEEASRVSGGGMVATFSKIMLPLMKPGFFAGWTILATLFLREFSTSLFLYSPRSETLGPLLYHLWLDAQHGMLGAVALILCFVSTALILVTYRFFNVGLGQRV